LCQTHAGDIDNVGAVGNGDFGMRAFECWDHGQDKVKKVVVEGEQGNEFSGCREVLVGWQRVFVFLRVFLIFADILTVEAFDDEHVDGNASTVAVASPLRVLDQIVSLWAAYAGSDARFLTIRRACS
jgi:hypothetical protein